MKHLIKAALQFAPDVAVAALALSIALPLGLILAVRSRLK